MFIISIYSTGASEEDSFCLSHLQPKHRPAQLSPAQRHSCQFPPGGASEARPCSHNKGEVFVAEHEGSRSAWPASQTGG